MTDQELCDRINATLSDRWQPFEPARQQSWVQSRIKSASYGVIGRENEWYILFPGQVTVAWTGPVPFTDLEEAMAAAEQEWADEL